MSKSMNEVLEKVKGTDKVSEIVTGKGSFSKAGFNDLVSAMVNDTTYKIPTYDKDGNKTGEINISELIRNDLKKTLEHAKYPQASEASILDNCEISTKGLAEAIPHFVMEQIATGKKFDLPTTEKSQGSIYLSEVPGGTKETKIRDPKTQTDLGTITTTSQNSIQVRTKSPVPSHLQVKVRKDPDGNVIK